MDKSSSVAPMVGGAGPFGFAGKAGTWRRVATRIAKKGPLVKELPARSSSKQSELLGQATSALSRKARLKPCMHMVSYPKIAP